MAAGQRIIAAARTTFLLCDIQDRFRDRIFKFDSVVRVAGTLGRVAQALSIPLIATEQYPKALLPTVKELQEFCKPENTFSKMKFSMATPEVLARVFTLQPDGDTMVLFGIEAHVCILQTALDFLRLGKTVYVVVDGVSSQRQGDRTLALRTLEQAGARLTTTESVIFLLLETAENPSFKGVQRLVIEHNKQPSELDYV